MTIHKKGAENGSKILLTAHLDEIGFVFKNITSDGFLKIEKVGDFPDIDSIYIVPAN